MGIFFTAGEKKKRAGVYQRYTNAGTPSVAGATNGIAAMVVKSNWGPLDVVGELYRMEDIAETYGNGGEHGTVHLINEIFTGGASTVKVVRIGSGGTKGTVKLKDTTADTALEAITMTAKYEGSRSFQYAIKVSLDDDQVKELVIYEAGMIIEKISFPISANDEVDALVENGKKSKYFTFKKEASYAGTGVLAVVTQVEMPAGTDPVITNADYSAAFVLLEAHKWNTIAVDTADISVHTLLSAYMDRVYKDGKMGFAVFGEPISVDFATRISHAKAWNSYLKIYVGGGWIDMNSNLIDGVKAVARIAGMVASVPTNQSLTHRVISGAVGPAEKLTNSQHETAIVSGMITFSTSSVGAVWIESGITTLNTLTGEDDEGWKKIKRAKVRFELMSRASDTVEPLIGNINNNPDGRATVLQAIQGLLNNMTAEEKLLDGASITLDPANKPEGDSAWFIIDADDVDALEKVYFLYKFRFAPIA